MPHYTHNRTSVLVRKEAEQQLILNWKTALENSDSFALEKLFKDPLPNQVDGIPFEKYLAKNLTRDVLLVAAPFFMTTNFECRYPHIFWKRCIDLNASDILKETLAGFSNKSKIQWGALIKHAVEKNKKEVVMDFLFRTPNLNFTVGRTHEATGFNRAGYYVLGLSLLGSCFRLALLDNNAEDVVSLVGPRNEKDFWRSFFVNQVASLSAAQAQKLCEYDRAHGVVTQINPKDNTLKIRINNNIRRQRDIKISMPESINCSLEAALVFGNWECFNRFIKDGYFPSVAKEIKTNPDVVFACFSKKDGLKKSLQILEKIGLSDWKTKEGNSFADVALSIFPEKKTVDILYAKSPTLLTSHNGNGKTPSQLVSQDLSSYIQKKIFTDVFSSPQTKFPSRKM